MRSLKALITLCALTSSLMLAGCGSPYSDFNVVYDSVKLTSTSDSAKVTFELFCQEYAGRNEADTCRYDAGSDTPMCYEVYWMPSHYEGSRWVEGDETENIEQGSTLNGETLDVERALLKGNACRSFSLTPETLTYEVSFDQAPPTEAVELVIQPTQNRENSHQGRAYIYPLVQPEQPAQ